jgi:ParB family transcriptional regulator, chromosome partitioning protein
MMSEQLYLINICDIDLTDQRYKISFTHDCDIKSLAQSIKEAGLICPPIVRQSDDKYIIVSGFNRIKACINNHYETIAVHKINSEASEYRCFVQAITALAFKRQLSQAELIISIKYLDKFLDKKQIADKSAAILNVELNVRYIKDLLDIAALPEPVLDLIHQGNISFKTAKKMLSFQKESIKSFFKIFDKIKASNNKQLEIMQYIVEISKRDCIELKNFLKNQDIESIILNKNKEPVLKTKLLRDYLYEQRFPNLSKVRKKVKKKINNLKFGNKIRLSAPENFESQNYSISFTAKNYKEFKTNVKTLNNVLENKKLKGVFEQ